jgi:putative intracellular protease/amidase/YHS domain-containing protein
MNRRKLLQSTAMFSVVRAIPRSFASVVGSELAGADQAAIAPNPLRPPAAGSIPVAFLISEGAVVIDFCGPWEVFQRTDVSGRMGNAFQLYTVGETTNPIQISGGMKIVPNYSLKTAPAPKVIVIPAQNGHSEATLEWIRQMTKKTDVTMSVCTGAFLLAETGLLSGKAATTHHGAYKSFAVQYPDIQVKRGARFVEVGNLATAGGLSSGIDLALRVVERYFGREAASKTAFGLEYQGQGWTNANSNEVYAKAPISTDQHPLCAVCDMEVDPQTALTSVYKGKTYRFCMKEHKTTFDAGPEKFLEQKE